MTRIDIFSGFLGAGKTTLIKKLIADGYKGEKLVLIENEFGEIGIDGGFMQDAGIVVNEMNSGCICCSLTGDFRKALQMVVAQYAPDRVLIEPSGVGKLSEIVAAVQSAQVNGLVMGGLTTVVDASKPRVYMKNFGEFFDNQIKSANCIILSRTGNMDEAKIEQAEELLRAKNPDAVIVSTPWDKLTGAQILDAIDRKSSIGAELAALLEEHAREEAEDDDDDDDDECCHHDHDEHDHDEHDHEGHEHHHHHHHHHDGEHDADEVFQSWGAETAKKYTSDEISRILNALQAEDKYGLVVRAKGYVPAPDGTWVYFDYTPGEENVRPGPANVAGRVCVIGSGLNETAVRALFGL